eukprot:13425305-Ditylum_brightwellii.AAC.1
MVMPKSGAKPVYAEDILTIVGNKDWYNKDIEKARNQLWMMQYSIFKTDYDDWMKSFEKEWLERLYLKYETNCTSLLDAKKGCIYLLILKYVGNL